MARVRTGEPTTFNITVTNDDGDPRDAPEIEFQWKTGTYGRIRTVTPSRTDTGQYAVAIVPCAPGNLYYLWRSVADDVCEEGIVSVAGQRTSVCIQPTPPTPSDELASFQNDGFQEGAFQ